MCSVKDLGFSIPIFCQSNKLWSWSSGQQIEKLLCKLINFQNHPLLTTYKCEIRHEIKSYIRVIEIHEAGYFFSHTL